MYITLHYIILHYITLYSLILYYIISCILHYITLYYITLHYILLSYIFILYHIYIEILHILYPSVKFTNEIQYFACILPCCQIAQIGPVYAEKFNHQKPTGSHQRSPTVSMSPRHGWVVVLDIATGPCVKTTK